MIPSEKLCSRRPKEKSRKLILLGSQLETRALFPLIVFNHLERDYCSLVEDLCTEKIITKKMVK